MITFASVVSLLALILSLYNTISNRKTLSVQIKAEGLFNRVVDLNNKDILSQHEKGVFIGIQILNPSPKDIGYFNLQFIDAASNKAFGCLSKEIIDQEFESKRLFAYNTHTKRKTLLHLIDSKFGTIPSNSLRRFETIVFPTSQNFIVTFKVPIRTFKKNPYAKSDRYFKHYSEVIKLSDEEWQELRNSKYEI